MSKRITIFVLGFITLLFITSKVNPVSAVCNTNGNCPAGYLACSATDPNPFACCTNPATECSTLGPAVSLGSPLTILCTNPLFAGLAGTNSGAWYEQQLCQYNNKVFDTTNPQEIFGERYTFAQLNWIVNSLTITAINNIFGLARLLPVIGSVYPASDLAQNTYPGTSHFKSEVQNTLSKFDLAPSVSAQGTGFGFDNLSAVRELWAASRNSAYLLLVLILIASGFMVMFRIKISPQAAVTVQLLIPKIIIALLVITFSYAISGFIIDLIYVFLNFIIWIMPDSIISDPATAATFFGSGNLGPMITTYLVYTLATVVSFATVPGAVVGGLVVGIVLALIFLIVLIFLMVRILGMLFMAYVNLLIQIIIGPWRILLGAIPGQSGISGWLKEVAANASVFVVVPLMFIFSLIMWRPPNAAALGPILTLLGIPNGIAQGVNTLQGNLPAVPALGAFVAANPILQLLFGFAILALIPKAANIIRDAIKTPGFKYGSAFSEALGPLSLAQPAWNSLQNFAAARATNPKTRPAPGPTVSGTPGGTVGGGGVGGNNPPSGSGGGLTVSSSPSYRQSSPVNSAPQLPAQGESSASKASEAVIDGSYRVK